MDQNSSKKINSLNSGRWYSFLLAGCSALTLAVATTPLLAREIIDGGAHEIVNGNGGGTKPSPWIIGSDLYVGETGVGELTVENAGRVQADGFFALGYWEGSAGSAEVTGEGSAIEASYIIVGREGNGTLIVENGATVSSQKGIQIGIGYDNRNSGSILVTGAGSQIRTVGGLIVGRGASGTLSIADGGHVSSTQLSLGSAASDPLLGSGIVFLQGTNAARGILETGYIEKRRGNAGLHFDGGLLRATGDEADFLRNLDAGDVTINAGGAFIDSNSFAIGINASMQGTGNLHNTGDGTLSLTGGLDIGGLGVWSGELGILGDANVLSGTAEIDAAGQPAKLTVDGQNTSLEAKTLSVGRAHVGLFDLTGGAQVSMRGLSSANAFVLGHYLGSEGQALISGAGSSLHVAGGTTRIGREGDGNLQIVDGGRFESGYLVTIGDYGSGDGRVSVSGDGSAFVTTGDAPTYIGSSGTGTLEIVGGGYVETSFLASVGRQDGGDGRVLVSDESTKWLVDGNLKIGEGGKGTVVLTNGGHVDLGDTSYSHVTLGTQEDGSGTLVIGAEAGLAAAEAGMIAARSINFSGGSGVLVFNHTDENYVFGIDLRKDLFNPAPNGDHSIEHLAGHTTFTGNGSQFDGVTTISGGTFAVDGRLGGIIDVNAGGTLGGSGTVGDTVISGGGILAPGRTTSALTVDGNLTLMSGSNLNFELGGAGASATTPGISSRVNVTGDLDLNGTLNLAQSSDPANEEAGFGYYRLMTYGGALSGDGLIIGQTPNVDNAGYFIDAAGGNVDLFIASAGDDTLQRWQGGDGVWSATNAQWLNKDGEFPVSWTRNHAVFKNEPGGFDGGTISVEGSQSFKGLQFVDDGYRMEGEGALETVAEGSEIRVLADSAEIATEISGVGGIVKTEAGTLILSGNNGYEGGTVLGGGTLSVSADTNLGEGSGALTFNGGILQVTGTGFRANNRDIVWGAQGGGFDITEAGNYFHVGQNIVGGGDLLKTGQGSLRLTGDNAYGNTLIAQGQVFGNAASISGNIGNAGTVIFEQETDDTFDGDIGSFDGSAGSIVKVGIGNLKLTGRSSLDWIIGVGGVVTAAEGFSGNADIVDGASLAFDQNIDATYDGVLIGNGLFVKSGAGALSYNGVSADFTGTTDILGGALIVGSDADHADALLGGSFNVDNGGTLGGHGTVGTGEGSIVVIASGGMLLPGNSIGALTVNGDLVFEAGSRLAVEVVPGKTESDLVAVTGNALLNGGSVAYIGANGNYNLRSSYTILSADGALAGTFDTVSSDFAFLMPSLTYDYGAGTVDLNLERNDRDFASLAFTRNQKATAGGIESIGFDIGDAVYDAIAQLSDDENLIRTSFDALSGEIYGSAKSALIEDSSFIRNTANDRIRAAFGNAGASTAPVLAYGPGGLSVPVSPGHAGPVFWSHGFGSWGSTDSDGNAADLKHSTGGLLIGADTFAGDWRVGLLAGYSHSTFKVNGRASEGSSDNYHLGLYGGTQWGNVAFRSGAAYSWHNIEASRSVLLPGFIDSLKGDYNAGTFQAFGEIGYGFEAGTARLEPFANLAYVNLHTGPFVETGGEAALSVRGQTTETTVTTLGLRAEHALSLDRADVTLKGMIGWRHAFGDTTPESTHVFSAGDAFTIAGVPIARDSAVLEAGLDFGLTPDATLGLSYAGQLASQSQEHGFKANLSMRF